MNIKWTKHTAPHGRNRHSAEIGENLSARIYEFVGYVTWYVSNRDEDLAFGRCQNVFLAKRAVRRAIRNLPSG